MEEARSRTTGGVWDAEHFAALSSGDPDSLRETRICRACGADAYFIREARNGRRACFAARPHREDCELASFATDDGGGAPLDEVDELINVGDIFRIDPNRGRTSTYSGVGVDSAEVSFIEAPRMSPSMMMVSQVGIDLTEAASMSAASS